MMPATKNRQWRLKRRPEPDEVIGAQNFEFAEESLPDLSAGEILVRTICLGTSPAQRSYVSAGLSMHDKVPIGDVMRGRGVGQVVASRHDGVPEGQIVVTSLGWQDYSVHKPDHQRPFTYSFQKVTHPVKPLSTALGTLGSAAHTAYFGLLDVGELKTGDTVVISAAAGGVGSVAGQIARIKGATAIGIAGGPEKCSWLTADLGFDAAIDYRNEDIHERLSALCTDGVNVFFDNVGGAQLDTVLQHLALNARIAICGFISLEPNKTEHWGPKYYTNLVRKRARMEGFFVWDYVERYAESEAELREWFLDGRLVNTEDVDEGLENMPDALASLFKGTNKGIKLVRVSPDPN